MNWTREIKENGLSKTFARPRLQCFFSLMNMKFGDRIKFQTNSQIMTLARVLVLCTVQRPVSTILKMSTCLNDLLSNFQKKKRRDTNAWKDFVLLTSSAMRSYLTLFK